MANDYVQASDLETLVAGLDIDDAGNGALTSTEADLLIASIEGEVNGVLYSLGIDAPVTLSASPKSYKFVRALVIQGVLAMVQASLHALSDDTEGSREAAFWRR